MKKRINSNKKGGRGERMWRDVLIKHGYDDAYRTSQFCGNSPKGTPDVACESLESIHFEVKFVEKLNLELAFSQAKKDAKGKMPLVAHKRSHQPWRVTMSSDDFFKILKAGDLNDKVKN